MTLPRQSGRFVAGHSYSKRTQFRKGQAAPNHVPVGTVRIRIETNTGSARAWVKVANPNVWRKRAVVVWERAHHRRVPKGKIVHHKDRNTLNDSKANLVALTRREHTDEHRIELLRAAAAQMGMKLIRMKNKI